MQHNIKCKKIPVFSLIKAVLFFIVMLGSCTIMVAQVPENTISNKNAELFRAIRSVDMPKLEQLIKNGADVNATFDGFSALMAASLNGSVEQMEMLINHGADINYKNAEGISALWLAVPDLNKVSLLVTRGADVQALSKEGHSVAIKAALFPGSVEMIKLFVAKGVDLKKASRDNMMMYNAAATCDTSLLSYLIHQGLDVNDTTFLGDYPVNAAMNYRCYASLKLLVENGAKVDVSMHAYPLDLFNGMTPLMYAALANDRESFYYLLEHGADPNAKSKTGYNVMMYLQQSHEDCPELTNALLHHGCNPLHKAPDGKDALYYAKKKGNTRSGEILAKYVNK